MYFVFHFGKEEEEANILFYHSLEEVCVFSDFKFLLLLISHKIRRQYFLLFIEKEKKIKVLRHPPRRKKILFFCMSITFDVLINCQNPNTTSTQPNLTLPKLGFTRTWVYTTTTHLHKLNISNISAVADLI